MRRPKIILSSIKECLYSQCYLWLSVVFLFVLSIELVADPRACNGFS